MMKPRVARAAQVLSFSIRVLPGLMMSFAMTPSIAHAAACINLPVSCTVSSNFGPRLHPVQKVWKNHNGTDFACPVGTPISNALEGNVIFSGYHSGGGNIVKVRNGQYEFKYMHNQRNTVEVGQQLSTGNTLALSGNTGKWTTGPHLHFEVWQSGRAIDPLSMMCGTAPASPPASDPPPPGTVIEGAGGTGSGQPSGEGMTVRDGLDGSIWDVLSSIIESRALNPDYTRQLSELDQTRLIEELNYLEGVKLRVDHERAQAMDRIIHNRAVLNALKTEAAKRGDVEAQRAAAMNSLSR